MCRVDINVCRGGSGYRGHEGSTTKGGVGILGYLGTGEGTNMRRFRKKYAIKTIVSPLIIWNLTNIRLTHSHSKTVTISNLWVMKPLFWYLYFIYC